MHETTIPNEQKQSFTISCMQKRNTLPLIIMTVIVLVTLASSLTSSRAMSATGIPIICRHNRHIGQAKPISTPTSRHTSDTASLSTISLAKSFMNALIAGNYGTLWSLLHQTMQAKWSNRAAFIAFWQKRFANYRLASYTLGHTQTLSFWVDPETMHIYKHVYRVSVSLSIQPRHTLSAALFPPENVRPGSLFQNLPFIVQPMQGIMGEHGKHWAVLVGGPADTEAPLLPPITPVTRSLNVPILMYHHISDSAPPPDQHLWTVTIERFTTQLDYLQAHGYHSITFNQLFDALYYDGPLPAKPIILTFDDGLEDSYQEAYPILWGHHFSGMFYIVSGKVGWDGQMTWPQLREMLAHGMQMGAHTIHHVNLATVLLNSAEQSQQELQIPPIVMQQQLGIVIQHFCYPYGEPFYRGGSYQRQQVLKLLPADGYIDATVAVGTYSGITQTSASPFTLPRVPVFGFENLSGFAASLPWV